jgi:hypothetical protein
VSLNDLNKMPRFMVKFNYKHTPDVYG